MLLSSNPQVLEQLGSHSLLFEKSFQQEKVFVLVLSESLLKQLAGGDQATCRLAQLVKDEILWVQLGRFWSEPGLQRGPEQGEVEMDSSSAASLALCSHPPHSCLAKLSSSSVSPSHAKERV